jgi:outer membrane receptor protein involved in Fe transport
MKSKTYIAFALMHFSIMSVWAQSTLDGKWRGNMQGPGGNVEMTYQFRTQGDQLEGNIESPMGTTEIENGSVSDDEFSFDLSFREMKIPHQGQIVSSDEVIIKNVRGAITLARVNEGEQSINQPSASGYTTSKKVEVGYGKLTGKLVEDGSGEPIPFATVALIDASGVTVDGTIADDNGDFIIKSIPAGTYKIQASFIGYEPYEVEGVTFTGRGENQDLGNVKLSNGSISLDEVVVEGERELIEEKVDRMVYNAEQDKTTAGGDAVDVLRRVPMLTVDLDGNVSLRGSSNIRVLIDNRPSTITASSIGDALKQIPADQIKSVEVITSPSARHDAEGTSGIINIITKKNNLQGGSLNLRTSTGLRGANLGLNAALRKGRTGFTLGGFGRTGYNIKGEFENTQTLKDDTGMILSTTNQSAKTLNNMLFGRYNLGWDYEINKYNWVGITGNFGMRRFSNTQNDRLSQTYQSDLLVSQLLQDVNNLNASFQTDVNLTYIRSFEEKGKEFSILGLYSQNDQTNNFETENLGDSEDIISRLKNINESDNKEMTVQVDYVEPIGEKQIVEVGGKMINRLVNSDYEYLVSQGTYDYEALPNRDLTNQFDYNQNVTAGYLSYTVELPKDFSLKAGGRYEYTTIDALFGDEVSLDIPSYGLWVPSVNVSKKLGMAKTIKAAYNRRIQRPSLQFLNPNIQAANPLDIRQGNPNLNPEYTDNYELSYSTFKNGKSINISAFVRNTEGSIQSVRETRGDTVYTSYQNIGEEDAYGLSLFTSLRIGQKFMLNGGVDGYYVMMNNNVSDPLYNASNSGFVLSGRLFGSYKITDQWAFQAFSFVRGNRVQLQGSQNGFYVYSLNLNRTFANDKGSIGFGADNFLQSAMVRRTTIESAFIDQQSTNYMYNANFKINFSYQIGKLTTSPTRRKRKSIDNDDMKQDNSGNTMNYK